MLLWRNMEDDPDHDKTSKMIYAPSKDSEGPEHLPSLIRVFAVRMKKHWVLGYPLSALQRLWSDWADARADLSLLSAHAILLVLSWGGSDTHLICFSENIWATSWKNQQNHLCTQRRLKSTLTSAQSDQSLSCPHGETLDHWVSLERIAKTLISRCPGWFESSLDAQVVVFVLSRCWLPCFRESCLFVIDSVIISYTSVPL